MLIGVDMNAPLDKGSVRDCEVQDLFFPLGQLRKIRFSCPEEGGPLSDTVSSSSTSGTTLRSRRHRPSSSMVTPTLVKPPHEHPFTPTDSAYFTQAVEFALFELAESVNLQVVSCCAGHAYLDFVSAQLDSLKSRHSCRDTWPENRASWQCDNCTALIFPTQSEEACWLCDHPRCNYSDLSMNG